MKSRRHLTILLLLVASVFLCLVACGIPTYIKPSVTISQIESKENENTFEINYASDDLGTGGKVGLLLLFDIESLTPAEQRDLISEFKRKYMNSSDYDGNPLRASDNEPVITKTISSEEVSLYALYKDETRIVGAPDYSFALDSSGHFISRFKLKYNKYDKNITLIKGDVELATLYLNTTSDPKDKYIALYAAVSVQSPEYSNYFWSKLFFVGYIKVTD